MPGFIFVIFFVTVTAIVAAVHIYLWRTLRKKKLINERIAKYIKSLFIIGGVSIPLASVLWKISPSESLSPISFFSSFWLGLVFFSFWVFFLLDLSLLLIFAVQRFTTRKDSLEEARENVDQSRRQFLVRTASLTALAASTGIPALGTLSAYSDPDTTETLVRLPRWPRQLDGFRIAQLSDVHLGPTIGSSYIGHIVAKTNALKPDIVCITGDLVDGTVAVLGDAASQLGNLKSRYGTFFTTGNHEFYSDWSSWHHFLKRIEIRVLSNERVFIGDSVGFDLAGVHDIQGRAFGSEYSPNIDQATSERNQDRELILLAHQPRYISEIENHGVGLQLSGHTHGGQIWPFHYAVKLLHPYISGLHQHNNLTQIYVSRGTGFWGPPIRIGAPPEISNLVIVNG